MRNELIWFLMLICVFSFVLFAFRSFGRVGLYIMIPLFTVLANIQVTMLVRLFSFDATLGNILYAASFLITDILSENYSEQDAKRGVNIGFISLIGMCLIMQIAIQMMPNPAYPDNFAAVKSIFGLMPRIVGASLLGYYVSQHLDVWMYGRFKARDTHNRFMWLRNNFCTLVSQIADNFLFVMVAFYGVYPREVLLDIFISTYVIKGLIALCDTPFLYIACHMFKNHKVNEA